MLTLLTLLSLLVPPGPRGLASPSHTAAVLHPSPRPTVDLSAGGALDSDTTSDIDTTEFLLTSEVLTRYVALQKELGRFWRAHLHTPFADSALAHPEVRLIPMFPATSHINA